MAFFEVKTLRLVGGGALLVKALQPLLTGNGFALPGLDRSGVMNFYLPIVGAIALLFPGVVPNGKMIGAIIALVVGGNAVLLEGKTQLTAQNVIDGYAPITAGALLLL